MVIGGFVGLGLWRVLDGVTGLPHSPAPFIVVGMMACFGSIAHAPLAVMLMVAEMTGSLALLPPAMIALGLAALIVGQRTIYESQLRSRVDAPAHRAAFGLPLLSSISVTEAMQRPRLVLDAATTIDDTRQHFEAKPVPGAPVIDEHGDVIGVLSRDSSSIDDDTTAGSLADRTHPTVSVDHSLDVALDTLVSAGITWAPVTEGRVLRGIIAITDIIAAYQRGLRRSQHLLADLTGTAVIVEAVVDAQSPFAGTPVREAPWPRGSVALSVDRHSQLITPQPDTTLEAGDVVVVVVPADREHELRQRFNGSGDI
jgi:CBS domain-containing protein